MNNTYPKGSEWRKWDLHVHTPISYQNEFAEWDKYIEKLKEKAVVHGIEVVGINDYFSVDGYEKLIKECEEETKKVTPRIKLSNDKWLYLFPVVELRLENFSSDNESVNIHMVFSPDILPATIRCSFLEKLTVKYQSLDLNCKADDLVKIGYAEENNGRFDTNIDLSTITDEKKKSLINKALKIISFSSSIFEDGIEKFKKILEKSGINKNKYLIIIAYKGHGGLDAFHWLDKQKDLSRSGSIRQNLLNLSDVCFSNDDDDIQFLLGQRNDTPRDEILNRFRSLKPCVWGSDAKTEENLFHPSNGKTYDYTWIKADPTFEGLKQIIYDPESRVGIQEKEPLKPHNVIDSITLNIPGDAKINVKQKGGSEKQELFCFAGVNGTFGLSPYFNCFIGGRGSGKSTILNFLGQRSKDPDSSINFWERIQPSFDNSDENIFSFDGVPMFEFIGQSEVESFATNTKAFTEAIYERANTRSDGKLEEHKIKLSALLNKLISFQSLIETFDELVAERESKEKEKKILKSAIKITESQEYSEIVKKITQKSNQKQELERWRITIDELRNSISSIQKHFSHDSEGNDSEDNEGSTSDLQIQKAPVAFRYQEAYRQVKANIEAAADLLDKSKFKDLVEKENSLSQEIDQHEKELSQLLKNAGLSDENILQVKSAPQKLVRVDDELLQINKKIEDKEKELSEYEAVLAEVQQAKMDYEGVIADSIRPLVETLEQQAKDNDKQDVKNIGLRYFFDEQQAWKETADDFYEYFPQFHRTGDRPTILQGYMVENKSVFAGDLSKISEHLSKEEKKVQYIEFLRDAFEGSANYQMFKTIRDKHLNDVVGYKRIQVLYDGKDIENASFGQKCTAVMVILLLFGHYPLIIDEPEAHLDSSLIANYLVPLIKRTKSNRQIIFATHNANFVINGDSEKIFILKNETGITEVIETTIENLENRSELLKLEGGKEAFRKRGEKLHI